MIHAHMIMIITTTAIVAITDTVNIARLTSFLDMVLLTNTNMINVLVIAVTMLII